VPGIIRLDHRAGEGGLSIACEGRQEVLAARPVAERVVIFSH